MSIFNASLPHTICAQLKARERVVSQNMLGEVGGDPRSYQFLQYTTAKNSWVKLRSFVDYDSYSIDYSQAKATTKTNGKYKGNQLAKKYVLAGGTLYKDPNYKPVAGIYVDGGYILREGIGEARGVYAGDIDGIGNNLVQRPFGYRPMPGITSVEISNRSAYGSLRDAVVNFYCWDKHQLEELEILYMRVGYSCLLEWGWSLFLDYPDKETEAQKSNRNRYPDDITINNYVDINFIDVFDSKLTEDKIYTLTKGISEGTNHNYDAMLGIVKNFSWQLMPNGGYQCSTTLTARGEAIETIKASSNPTVIVGSIPSNPPAADDPAPNYSVFEKIFLNLIGFINGSEWYKSNTFQEVTNTPGSFYDAIFEGGGSIKRTDLEEVNKNVFSEINKRLLKTAVYVDYGKYGSIDRRTYSGNKEFFDKYIDLNNNILATLVEGGTDQGSGIEYIRLTSLIAILNEFFIPKDKDTKDPIIHICMPYFNKCLWSEDSVSIDVTTCLIFNSKATFVCGDANPKGFLPHWYKPFGIDSDAKAYQRSDSTAYEFDGNISNIYISISKINQIYRNLSGDPNGVDIIQFLQELMNAVSFALGGINDFKLFNDKKSIQIIDVKYLGGNKAAEEFNFDLIGLKSICRDVKMNSRVYSEQMSMMAIAAMAGNQNTGQANLGDIYSSTQNYLNLGLKDRLASATFETDASDDEITVGNGVVLSGNRKYYFNIYNNLINLEHYINRNCLGLDTSGDGTYTVRLPQYNEIINASSLLKTFHYQINSKDVDFKAFIPFELEITLDGIGGFVVGQIFTIDKSILPIDYFNKNLGFVVTGISHSLQNNDWITTLKTQIVLLENDKIPSFGVDKDLLKKTLQKIRKEANKIAYIRMALADLLVHITLDAISEKRYNCSSDKGAVLYRLSEITDEKKIESMVYGVGGRIDDDNYKKLATYAEANTNFGILFGGKDKVMNYLKNWFEHAKTQSLSNFPDNFDEFTTSNILGVTKKFDVEAFVKFVFSTGNPSAPTNVIINADINNCDGSNNASNHPSYKEFWENSFWYKAMNKNGSQVFKSLPIDVRVQDLMNTPLGSLISTQSVFQFSYDSSITAIQDTLYTSVERTGGNEYSLRDENSLKALWSMFRNWIELNKHNFGFDGFNPSDFADAHFEKLHNTINIKVPEGPVGDSGSPIESNPNNPAMGGIMSDINLKEDIKLIGKSKKGINIYNFKYKNQDGYYEGVIAQELIGTEFEHAVIKTNNYLAVDYNQIDVEFKKL